MVSFFRRLGVIMMCALSLLIAPASYAETMSAQTDVDRARHVVDYNGVPQLDVAGVGLVGHPAWVALYALAYAGVENYKPELGLEPDQKKFASTIDWLKRNLSQNAQGQWVWPYEFNSTYNDVSIVAPWGSAFAQATGVQALLAHWRQTGDKTSLDIAVKAAEALFASLADGGFLFQSGEDIWFEEIPAPVQNPSHILNGHLRVLLAIAELEDATGDERYADWLRRGEDTLLRWLPRYDAGYWLRYDLNPRKQELLFRLANPYGFDNPDLAIDRILLRDPVSGQQAELDVGKPGDDAGALRIAGTDWGQIEKFQGRTIRKLRPVPGVVEAAGSEGQMVAPYIYFYLTLPGSSEDNLRRDPYELTIEYFDEKPGNVGVQMRSIAPGSVTFRSLADGDLLISGAGKWRQWKVPVLPRDLGYWVGNLYARKHTEYLERLSQRDERFKAWAAIAKGYERGVTSGEGFEVVRPAVAPPLHQTPVLPFLSLDDNGVLMQHMADDKSRFDGSGLNDFASGTGKAVYSPFIIASQLLDGEKSPYFKDILGGGDVDARKPALDWLLSKSNQTYIQAAITYLYPFQNVYNDVLTKEPWQSAFGQAYVLKALNAAEGLSDSSVDLDDLIDKVARAYGIPLSSGGLSTIDKEGEWFFEEVPNATHVLNAHLVSTSTLADIGRDRTDPNMTSLADEGLETLRSKLRLFDAGYWLRYDLNPRKALLFQLDWLEGTASPLIESIALEAPQFGQKVQLTVGSDGAFEGASKISGLDWSHVVTADGRRGRAFANGNLLYAKAVEGGTRQNVYALLQLPNPDFRDYFEVLPHRLTITYKDVAPGKFNVKIQSINAGEQLAFVPLRGAVLTTTGDQRWKQAVFEVRPQDMGWFKGLDYQRYEIEQLQDIAGATGEWFFEQYAERQQYYLDTFMSGGSPIVPPAETLPRPATLSIIEASPTYKGFDFSSALDGDPNDDYVAGIEGDGSYTVDLRLDHAITDGRIEIRWESPTNHAREIKVFSTDGAPKLLADTQVQDGSDVQIDIGPEFTFRSLRVEFLNFAGQPRLLLRQFEIRGTPANEAVGTELPRPPQNLEDTFLTPDDPRNPIGLMGQPVTGRIKHLSDQLFRPEKDIHSNIRTFMKFIDGFETGVARSMSPDDTILERKGACGSFTNTLLALAAAQGLEGRIISLLNYPKDDGHVVAEIKLEQGWALYDPTYDAFYTHPGSDRPLSFEEIKSAYRNGQTLVTHRNSQRPGGSLYTGQDIFTQASPMGVIGPDKPFYFPLTLDVAQRRAVETADFGPQWQGADYLGAAYINQQQNWTITGLETGRRYAFRISPDWLGGDLSGQPSEFEVRAVIEPGDGSSSEEHHAFPFAGQKPGIWTISFIAGAQSARIALLHDYLGPKQLYMKMKRYELVELK